MKDDIKVNDIVRVQKNIFIHPENSPRIKVGEKEVKVIHRTPNFARVEFFDGTYLIDEEDGSINRDWWFPIRMLERIEVEGYD